jgi:hypothetical protein
VTSGLIVSYDFRSRTLLLAGSPYLHPGLYPPIATYLLCSSTVDSARERPCALCPCVIDDDDKAEQKAKPHVGAVASGRHSSPGQPTGAAHGSPVKLHCAPPLGALQALLGVFLLCRFKPCELGAERGESLEARTGMDTGE